MKIRTSRTGMTETRWAYLKALKQAEPRYIHVSAQARMIPNPLGDHLPWVPWTQRPGITFNEGRNRAKRERRAHRWGASA